MEPNAGGPALALVLVWLLCCLAAGASAAYSVPADPRVAGRAAEPVRAGAAMIGLLMAVLSTVALLLSSWS
ncbi:hypothetical protein TRIUR3_07689 [Triticum urartu]|uniref:Uncharacterized protein n=1 Tax=Triticum urartu TaxID=4572 RepID=M7ZP40_TRIUA|nr:hypothetical protein TRIUR3_07689 [Triticum urartu]